MRAQLTNYFRAGYPAVAVQTTEETRACADIVAAAKSLGRSIVTWSAMEGMIDVSNAVRKIQDTEDLMAACAQRLPKTVFILRDPQTWPFDRDPVLARAFRDFIAAGPIEGSSVVILAPQYRPHPTVEKLVTVVDYELPAAADLRAIVVGIAQSAGKPMPEAVQLDAVIRALGGLTTTEAENALALSLVETGQFATEIIYREKCAAVRKSGLLDIVEADPRGLAAVGGLDVLKAWIRKRTRVWSPEAAAFGLPQPKGLLLVGVPGAGKSLTARAVGTALGVPTLRLDVGTLFNSLVGESEARTRDALKLAEALAPCVLWIDEIDKGLAGSGGSGAGDSGVTRRVFGNIISWMQERKRPVFMVATANGVEGLPPELLRKGRFDEVFAIDLPSAKEREAIFTIHITKRGRDVRQFALSTLAQATQNFTGSEIEAVLDEAMFLAFDEGHELTTDDVVTAAQSIIPLAQTAKEQIDGIRRWAQQRARFASTPADGASVAAPPVRSLRDVVPTASGDPS